MAEFLELLSSYNFQILAIAMLLISVTASVMGTITVLRGEALIGETVGHASYPGLILAFIFFSASESILLILGAAAAGISAYFFVQFSKNAGKVPTDASLAITLSGFFGLGMLLSSFIQGNPSFAKASAANLGAYLFGQASYVMRRDLYIIVPLAVLSLLFILLLYQKIKISVFDPVYAHSIGINTGLIKFLCSLITVALISVGLKLLGTVLIASFLVIPGIAALHWTSKFWKVLLISSLISSTASMLGVVLSSLITGFSTGPSIVLSMSAFAILSVFFAPRGIIFLRKKRGIEDK